MYHLCKIKTLHIFANTGYLCLYNSGNKQQLFSPTALVVGLYNVDFFFEGLKLYVLFSWISGFTILEIGSCQLLPSTFTFYKSSIYIKLTVTNIWIWDRHWLFLIFFFLQVFLMFGLLVAYKNSRHNISTRQIRNYNHQTWPTVLPPLLSRQHSLVHVATKYITGGLTSGDI